MPPMLSIVGKSNSGKTTLIEKLIPELKKRGYRIGTVKHTCHHIEMDREGKDSARHKAAGADTVILASPGRINMIRDMECDALDTLLSCFTDMDLVITEGYKNENKPKIEVYRAQSHKTPLYDGSGDFIALATDANNIQVDIPKFGLDDIKAIADFIERKFL